MCVGGPEKCHLRKTGGNAVSLETRSKDAEDREVRQAR